MYILMDMFCHCIRDLYCGFQAITIETKSIAKKIVENINRKADPDMEFVRVKFYFAWVKYCFEDMLIV